MNDALRNLVNLVRREPWIREHLATNVQRKLERAERDQLLCELADERFGHLRLSAAVAAITRDLIRYAAGRWRFDQNRLEMPPEYTGTPRETLWRVMRASGGQVPTSNRHMRRILEHRDGES